MDPSVDIAEPTAHGSQGGGGCHRSSDQGGAWGCEAMLFTNSGPHEITAFPIPRSLNAPIALVDDIPLESCLSELIVSSGLSPLFALRPSLLR